MKIPSQPFIILLNEIKTLKTPILPSDKMKRLIAMETTDYELMLQNSLNKDDPSQIQSFHLLVNRKSMLKLHESQRNITAKISEKL